MQESNQDWFMDLEGILVILDHRQDANFWCTPFLWTKISCAYLNRLVPYYWMCALTL